jgi:hypothetical protein
MKRLSKFFDACKYFLLEAASVGDCIQEAQRTQGYLAELIELKKTFQDEALAAEGEYDRFMAEHRDQVGYILRKNGVKSVTERMVEDRVVRMHGEEYTKLRKAYTDAKTNFEVVDKLLMAMFQRKDLICETINYMRSKVESESCILKTKSILKKLGLEV